PSVENLLGPIVSIFVSACTRVASAPTHELRSAQYSRPDFDVIDADVDLMLFRSDPLELATGSSFFRPHFEQVLAVGGEVIVERRSATGAEGQTVPDTCAP